MLPESLNGVIWSILIIVHSDHGAVGSCLAVNGNFKDFHELSDLVALVFEHLLSTVFLV